MAGFPPRKNQECQAEVYIFENPVEEGITQPVVYISHPKSELAICGCPSGRHYGVVMSGNENFMADVDKQKKAGLKPKLVDYSEIAQLVEEANRVKTQRIATSPDLTSLVIDLLNSIQD